MSDAPAVNQGTIEAIEFDERIQRLNQQTMVQSALIKCQPGNRKGNTSKCWSLDGHTRYTCAFMHIVEFKSAQEVHDLLGDRMGDVDRRSLSGWLKTIRNAYSKIHSEQLENMKHAESLMYNSGDMTAVNTLTFAAIAPKFMAMSSMIDATTDPKILNVFLRLLEVSTAAAKIHADAKLAEARREKVLTDLRKVLIERKRKGKTESRKLTKDEALAVALEAVDEVMGTGGGS